MASNTLKELVDLIGLPACIALTRAYGGRTLRVPSRPNSTHPLLVTIGEGPTGKLCREFGGVHIEIPTERTALLAQRNGQIATEKGVGDSISTIARRYGLSRKMIRKILAQKVVGTGPTPL